MADLNHTPKKELLKVITTQKGVIAEQRETIAGLLAELDARQTELAALKDEPAADAPMVQAPNAEFDAKNYAHKMAMRVLRQVPRHAMSDTLTYMRMYLHETLGEEARQHDEELRHRHGAMARLELSIGDLAAVANKQ